MSCHAMPCHADCVCLHFSCTHSKVSIFMVGKFYSEFFFSTISVRADGVTLIHKFIKCMRTLKCQVQYYNYGIQFLFFAQFQRFMTFSRPFVFILFISFGNCLALALPLPCQCVCGTYSMYKAMYSVYV